MKTHEKRWYIIRSILDESFKGITDNWWMATRYEINNYDEFKVLFKAKYWSESTQNIVRDNLCHGRFAPTRGTPTAYFLGKVCLAKHIEPRIPEECLINKLSYHYVETIVRARLCGQVKMIQAMAALLENYEHENYYRQSRSRNYNNNNKYNSGNNNGNNNNVRNRNYNNSNNTNNRDTRDYRNRNNDQRPQVNYVRNNNNRYDSRNNDYRRRYQGRRSLMIITGRTPITRIITNTNEGETEAKKIIEEVTAHSIDSTNSETIWKKEETST